MLKNGKSANRNEHQNWKPKFFGTKTEKPIQKNIQNRKTENPNAPLIKWCCKLSFFLKAFRLMIIIVSYGVVSSIFI